MERSLSSFRSFVVGTVLLIIVQFHSKLLAQTMDNSIQFAENIESGEALPDFKQQGSVGRIMGNIQKGVKRVLGIDKRQAINETRLNLLHLYQEIQKVKKIPFGDPTFSQQAKNIVRQLFDMQNSLESYINLLEKKGELSEKDQQIKELLQGILHLGDVLPMVNTPSMYMNMITDICNDVGIDFHTVQPTGLISLVRRFNQMNIETFMKKYYNTGKLVDMIEQLSTGIGVDSTGIDNFVVDSSFADSILRSLPLYPYDVCQIEQKNPEKALTCKRILNIDPNTHLTEEVITNEYIASLSSQQYIALQRLLDKDKQIETLLQSLTTLLEGLDYLATLDNTFTTLLYNTHISTAHHTRVEGSLSYHEFIDQQDRMIPANLMNIDSITLKAFVKEFFDFNLANFDTVNVEPHTGLVYGITKSVIGKETVDLIPLSYLTYDNALRLLILEYHYNVMKERDIPDATIRYALKMIMRGAVRFEIGTYYFDLAQPLDAYLPEIKDVYGEDFDPKNYAQIVVFPQIPKNFTITISNQVQKR